MNNKVEKDRIREVILDKGMSQDILIVNSQELQHTKLVEICSQNL